MAPNRRVRASVGYAYFDVRTHSGVAGHHPRRAMESESSGESTMVVASAVCASLVSLLCLCAIAGVLYRMGYLDPLVERIKGSSPAASDTPSSDSPATPSTPSPPDSGGGGGGGTPSDKPKAKPKAKPKGKNKNDTKNGTKASGGKGGKPLSPCKSMPKDLVPMVKRWRASKAHQIHRYPALVRNKKVLMNAMKGAPLWQQMLLMAMGMQETNELTSKQRDASKDKNLASRNASLFNLNADMVQKLGYKGDFMALNQEKNLPVVVALIRKGFKVWGVDRTLAFVRGGSTTFKDLKSYNFGEFLNAMATLVEILCRNMPNIMIDDRRVAVVTSHQ